jgi:serine/threonine protein kinase
MNLHFNLLEVIGTGGFGKVWKVFEKDTKTLYAMKEMNKIIILQKQCISFVMNELLILTSLSNKFIVNLVKAY